MEFLKEFLLTDTLVKEEPEVVFNFKEVLERSAFMKLLSDSVTRDLKTEKKDEQYK